MINRYKRGKGKRVIFFMLITVTTLSVTFSVFGYRGWRKCLSDKQAMETRLNSYSHMVYVAAEQLPKGTVLTEDMLNLERKFFDLENINFISEEEIGQTVAVDIEQGTCVTTEMVYADKKNGREVFLTEIFYSDYVQAGDRVDVRIRYENAEDYTVLVDKIILACDAGNGFVLELTEEEILVASSAFSDKKIYEGTKLYVAKYPEYNAIESTGDVNYIPNKEILALLGREITEGESREALETRLMRRQ